MSDDPRLAMYDGAEKALKEQAGAVALKSPKAGDGKPLASLEDAVTSSYAAIAAAKDR